MFREGILREARDQEVRDRRSGRDLLLRAQMWSANNGEWTYEGRAIFPEPLQRHGPGRQLEPEFRNDTRTSSNERDANYEWAGEWTTDWDPVLQRMREYRILANSEDAKSGEEYFAGDGTTGFYRRYRPTRSEREARSEASERNNHANNETQDMEVEDEIPSVTQEGGRWVEYNRNEPPADANTGMTWTRS